MSDSDPEIQRLHAELFAELHALAQNQFRHQRESHTLQPTALVNEAWLKLQRSDDDQISDRNHFLCLAARIMRQVLVDHAREKRSEKRGGDNWRRQTFIESPETPLAGELDLLELEDVLEKLSKLSSIQAQLVELRFFAGSTMPEAAEALGLSLSDAERKWRMARTWLAVELRKD